MIRIPKLEPSGRSREFKRYPDEMIRLVVYKFLFEGKSHRMLEREVLELDSNRYRGYQAMGILHFFGLKEEFKGLFEGMDLEKGIGLLLKEGDEYRPIVDILIEFEKSENTEISESFVKNEKIKPLIRKIDLLQFTDSIIIEKEYHDIFNPPYSNFYTEKGNEREVEVLFNKKIFKANYRYEGQSNTSWELQSIQFKDNLKKEFEKIFSNREGDFSISMGKDPNYFIFDVPDGFSEMLYVDEDSEYLEGEANYKLHLQRERNPKLVRDSKIIFKQKNNSLFCEVCGFDFEANYGERGKDFIEAHHLKYISELEEREVTKISDIVMLCANCHRMIHRKPKVTFEEFRKEFFKNNEASKET